MRKPPSGAAGLPFDDKSFDISLASVTLCCIGPEEIERSLAEILRVTRRWIVIAEPFDDNPKHGTPEGSPDCYPNTTYWIRNYAVLFGDRAKLRSVRYIEQEHQMGHIRSVMVFGVTSKSLV
jgi:ubiquinone/menaquinone biosynthesis C-methylase UbiE